MFGQWFWLITGAQKSRLFKKFPKDVLQSLSEENITSNFHSWSLSMQVPTLFNKKKMYAYENFFRSYFTMHTMECHQNQKHWLLYFSCYFFMPTDQQCWGKLLLKVMHYNIAYSLKKVTNYVTSLLFMENNVTLLVRYFFSPELGLPTKINK